MENIILNLKKLIKTASLITLTSATFFAYTNDSVTAIKNTGLMIIKAEPTISQFVDVEVNTPYKELQLALLRIIIESEQKLENIKRSPASHLSKMATEIFSYCLLQFRGAYGVIESYEGKSSDHAGKFATDLKTVFSPSIAFPAITKKLLILRNEALKAKDNELIHIVDQLMIMIDKKQVEWEKRANAPLKLLKALVHRMKCK